MDKIDLNKEEKRFKTFTDKWPHAFINPRILAKIGFYYLNSHDEVECKFCKIKINTWEMGDDEVTEHYRWSPNCPLLNKKVTFNEPIEPASELDKLLLKIKFDECSKNTLVRSIGAYVETPLEDQINAYIKINETEIPDFPNFENELIRLNTFKNWPETKPSPKQLAKAGFFYTRKEDRVICFTCGGGLYEWVQSDNPFEQHILWYENC